MHVVVNHERRGFMMPVDGGAEFVFHAALHPGEDADAWTEGDARRLFAQAFGREIRSKCCPRARGPRDTRSSHSDAARAHLHRRRRGASLHSHGRPRLQHRGRGRREPGWKIAHVLRGAAGEQLLSSYEPERKPAAERNTGYARRFADSVGLYRRARLEEPGPPAMRRAAASAHLNAPRAWNSTSPASPSAPATTAHR